ILPSKLNHAYPTLETQQPHFKYTIPSDGLEYNCPYMNLAIGYLSALPAFSTYSRYGSFCALFDIAVRARDHTC
ncbi:hypothetical protein Dimus_001544, partial [Dionaea muscipula]